MHSKQGKHLGRLSHWLNKNVSATFNWSYTCYGREKSYPCMFQNNNTDWGPVGVRGTCWMYLRRNMDKAYSKSLKCTILVHGPTPSWARLGNKQVSGLTSRALLVCLRPPFLTFPYYGTGCFHKPSSLHCVTFSWRLHRPVSVRVIFASFTKSSSIQRLAL